MKTRQKFFIILLCLWSFIHLFLFLKNIGIDGVNHYQYVNRISYEGSAKNVFYPFTSGYYSSTDYYKGFSKSFDSRFYDYTELFFYVGGAWLVFFLIKYLYKKD
jgi:hypothetical protein